MEYTQGMSVDEEWRPFPLYSKSCPDCGGGPVTIPVREDTKALIEALGGQHAWLHNNPCPRIDWNTP